MGAGAALRRKQDASRCCAVRFTALAAMARKLVPDDVKALYPGEVLEFGTGYLIPKPFDRRLFVEVSYAVAEAAVRTGVARKPVDLAAYRQDLERRNATRQANT